MKRPRIIILRGRPTAGKSTAFRNLRKEKKMKDILFVDHCKQKEDFGRVLGKKVLYSTLKTIFLTKKDIILEEMSKKTINKHLRYYIKKYNYEFVVFQFVVDTKTAYRRDVERSKGKKPMGERLIKSLHKMHDERFDKGGVLVDTNKLNEKQVLRLILKELSK